MAVNNSALVDEHVEPKTAEINFTVNSKPEDIKKYLKAMVRSTFCGDEDRDSDGLFKLGKAMKELHLLIEDGKVSWYEGKRVLDELAELRFPKGSGNREKIEKDYPKFLYAREQVRRKIDESKTTREPLQEISVLEDDKYWGTRQQLRCGKIVGDMLGGLDPIFGALLNPTGGRVGPGNAAIIHTFFREEKPIAYHAASHDAFGYLLQYHDVGPGYNSLNYWFTLFKRESILSGHGTGLHFWKDCLKENIVGREY